MNNWRLIVLRAHSFPKPVTTFEELKEGLREICDKYHWEDGVVMPLVMGADNEGGLTISYLSEKEDNYIYGETFRIVTGGDENEIIDDFNVEFAEKKLGNKDHIKKFYYCFIQDYPPLNPWDEEEFGNENLTYSEKEERAINFEVLFPSRLWHQNLEEQGFGRRSIFDDWFGDRAAVAVTDDGHCMRVWDCLD